MMTGKPHTVNKHCQKFTRVCAKIVEEGDCDLFFLSEVGGFRQGLRKAKIVVRDFLIQPFGHQVCHSEIDNYLALWGFGVAPQPVRVSLHGDAEKHVLPIGRKVDLSLIHI